MSSKLFRKSVDVGRLSCSLFSVPQRRLLHDLRTTGSTSKDIALLMANFSHPPRPLTLATLLSFANPVNPESVLASASYVLDELPKRLAQRIKALDSLPFIVGTNPFVARIHSLHKASFQTLATQRAVEDLDGNWHLIGQLEALVQAHSNDIPTMAKGFQECARYMTTDEISAFLDDAIRSRIGIRLIAEQHVAISRTLRDPPVGDRHFGVVDMACSPAEMIKTCASFVMELCEGTFGFTPSFVVDGKIDSTFAYVPVHLEYILTELLKNSFRATVEHQYKLHGRIPSSSSPPVLITISPSPQVHRRPASLNIRIRDQGGGISPANIARVFSYAFTTARQHEDPGEGEFPGSVGQSSGDHSTSPTTGDAAYAFSEIAGNGLRAGLGTIAGLGYGLPLAALYARYFGGSLELRSLYGDGGGTDVFVKLRCLDQGADLVEI